ncbi:MAG: hypothetical protein JWN30_1941 [Bacilli bacterium]|nr:hypothetical protein [Bacilli bacterium]
MFIELGMGTDLHGQDMTKACVRAVENAIRFNSMPGLRTVLPGGDLQQMKVHVTLGVPTQTAAVDVERVKAVFPYGQVTVDITLGGLLTSSGVVLPDKGDRNDDLYVVVAAVKAGY